MAQDSADKRLNFIDNGPKYSIGSRYESSIRIDAPGPGNYEPTESGKQAARSSSFGVKIPKNVVK
jgi:hypothetical protein